MKRNIIIRGFLKSGDLIDELSSTFVKSDEVDLKIELSSNTVAEMKNLEVVADIVFAELDTQRPEEIYQLERYVADIDKQTSVFALLNNSNPETVRSLMRSGLRDVLSLPDNKDEFVTEIEDIIRGKQHDMQSINSTVVTFLNAKGGSGSTTIAVNTAYILKEKFDASVCLIDMDIQFGKCALFLDMVARETVLDAIRQPDRIDPLFIKALITHHPSGLDILASPCSMDDLGEISASTIGTLIEAVCQIYDYVLIDMPHFIAPWSVEPLRRSERNFMVVQRCFSIIRDAHLLLKKLPDYGVDASQIELINNRDSKDTGPISKRQMADMLERDNAFNIHNNYPLVIEAQEAGKPMETLTLGSAINHDIEVLAKSIMEGKSSASKGGFLKRLFH